MLYWALVFLVIALVAAALGFGASQVFLALLLVSLVVHFTRAAT
jgi:uncharacterized membrane protein YtjA (UPF0391 family)